MGNSSWPTTPVRIFFSAIPWQGVQASPVDAVKPQDWRSQTVRTFFARIPWDAKALAVHSPADTDDELSYLMSVQTFFSRFVWQGRPAIGAVPKLTLTPSKAPSLSLNDLSDLF